MRARPGRPREQADQETDAASHRQAGASSEPQVVVSPDRRSVFTRGEVRRGTEILIPAFVDAAGRDSLGRG